MLKLTSVSVNPVSIMEPVKMSWRGTSVYVCQAIRECIVKQVTNQNPFKGRWSVFQAIGQVLIQVLNQALITKLDE